MNTVLGYLGKILVAIVCYSFVLSIYGYILYNVVKIMAEVIVNAYKSLKADWAKWLSDKQK